jgi:antirestriction protein
MLNIFINTWGNYNENGADGGEWITLPMDEDALQEKLDQIAETMGDNDPEWFVNDYEWTSEIEPFEVHEMDNYFELNEQLNDLDNLVEWEQEEICAAVEAFGYSFMEAYDKQQRGHFTFYRNMELIDVAYELVENCYFTKDTPDIFTRYFDYKAFARDLSFDGYHETEWGVICE